MAWVNDFVPFDPLRFPRVDRGRLAHVRRVAASVDGMTGPDAYEVLAPEGMWPGTTDPDDVAEVVASYREGHPSDPPEVMLAFKSAEA